MEVYVVRLPRFGVKSMEILEIVAENVPLNKVKLVHCQHEYGLYQNMDAQFYQHLKMYCPLPIVTTMHATGYIREADQIIAMVSSRIIVHNLYCAKRLVFPSEIIPHGINPVQPMDVGDAKKAYGIQAEAPIVGYLGFISGYKGLEGLIEAVRGMENVGLLIAGGTHAGPDNDYVNKLKEQSLKALPSRVQWVGWVPDDRLAQAYGAMDIVAYPSVAASESGALLTALGYGKAVVASRLPPFEEKEKLGVLTTFGNVEELREKIKWLLNDTDARRALEKRAREYAEATSWLNVARLHTDLYGKVLNGEKQT